MSDSWSNRKPETGRGRPRAAPRSLKDALSEAGLGDAPPRVLPRDVLRRRDPLSVVPPPLPSVAEPEAFVASRKDVALNTSVAQQQRPIVEEVPSPVISASSRVDGTHGVVSPPPWLRAARRGRRQARALNAAGWFVTIMVVGSIITVAGRYLAVSPGGEHFYTARQ